MSISETLRQKRLILKDTLGLGLTTSAPSILGLVMWSSCLTTLAISTGFERRYNVLERIAATPLGRPGIPAGKALAIGIGAAAITILVTGWLAFSQGKEAGFGAGFKAARHEAAAASWANTPQGQVAYRLALVGSLEKVARCTAPGWKVKNGACLPYPDSDGSLHGWMMP